MLIDDKFKDVEKRNDDILGLRNMSTETISRLIKGPNPGAKRMICRINNPAYIAPENDAWRHQDSDSDNEETKMSEMIEKKTRWWFVRDGKRKRTPKTSPAVSILKIVVKGPSVEPQQRLVDETVLEPFEIIEQGAGLLKQSLKSYLKRNEEVAAQKEQSSSAQLESVQAEGNQDWIQQLLDEEDSSYEPDEPKKKIKKRKTVQAGVIPRRVRAKKSGAEPPKDKGGKKEKHLEKTKVYGIEKVQSVEIPKELEVQNVDVLITGYKVATPPRPPPQDQPESSHPKDTTFDYLFEGLPLATGIFREDILEDDYDMFNNEAVKELLKKVANLEKKES
ncbi:hypothetical protein Hanom_Chr16g01455611 [Helianthus anomalus]